jgi:hypothetical protein
LTHPPAFSSAHSAAHPHPEVGLHSWTLGRRRYLAFLVFLQDLLDLPRSPGEDLYPGRLESGESIGSNLSGNQYFHPFVGDQLGRLDSRSPGCTQVGILNGLKGIGIGINEQKILATAKTGVHFGIQAGTR